MKKSLKIDNWQVALMTVFSLFGNVINYFYQIYLGNSLQVSDYGAFNTINSLITNVCIVYSPVCILICKVTAVDRDNLKKSKKVLLQLAKLVLLFCAIITLLSIVFRSILFKNISTDNTWFTIAIIIISFSIVGIYSVVNGAFQGVGEYGWFGFFSLALMALKCAYVVVTHSSLDNAILSVLLSDFIIMVIMMLFLVLKYRGMDEPEIKTSYSKTEIGQLYSETFFVQMVYSLCINSGELLLLQYFYTNKAIGFYSAAITIAKIGMYVTVLLSNVVLPETALRVKEGAHRVKPILVKSIGLALIIGGGYAGTLFLFGNRIIMILYGKAYVLSAEMMKWMILYVIGLCVLPIVHNFFVGINRIRIYTFIMLITMMATIAAIALLHADILYLPLIMGIAFVCIEALSIAYLCRIYGREKNE